MSQSVPAFTTITTWANFFKHEKLNRDNHEPLALLDLATELSKTDRAHFKPYPKRIESRVLLVNKAMDLGIDLTKWNMGRGLLDIWNQEYIKRYGSIIGTPGLKESKRRNVKTKLSKKGTDISCHHQHDHPANSQ